MVACTLIMKRTLFLSLLALAIFSTSASASHNFSATYVDFKQEYYNNEVQYVYPTYTDGLRYYNSNNYTCSNDFSRYESGSLFYKKQKCILGGEIQLGEDMAFYNVSIYAIEKNYYGSYTSATLTGTKGTFFLNSAVTRLWSTPVQYSITGLDGVSLSGYTGYIDNENSAAYGLIAATGSNKHEILINRNYGSINLSNNSVTSTEQAPLKRLYSSVFTAIDSYFIGGEGNSFIQVDGNRNSNGTAVSISGNQTEQTFDGGSDMYHAYAGAIYASGHCDVSISSNTRNVIIQDNQVRSAGSHATGGAIALHGTDQLVRLNSNNSLNLSGNKAISTWSNPDKSTEYVTAGGAIYAATATVSIDSNGVYGDRDYTLSICNNSAEMDNGNVRGGAIDAHTLTMHGNQNGVQISGNYAITSNKTGTYSALGGALSAATSEGKHSIRETGDMWNIGIGYVDILNNYAKSESTQGIARGGFFHGADGTTLEISKNYGSINIHGNHVSTVNGAVDAALGGAIYGSSLIISDNSGSVNIYGNYEQYGDKYRMRAVYLDSADADSTLSLSAVSGKSIKFEDAVYANVKNITINGGEDGSGTVIFSGGNVERNFSNLGIENVSDEELAASRTSYFGSTIKVQGGTLEACYGAVLQGKDMEVAKGSNATVRLNSAAMHGGIVRFYESTTLAAAGSSTLEAGLLQMSEGSSMQFELGSSNAGTAALTYTGDLSLSRTINLKVKLDDRNYQGGTLKMLTLGSSSSHWESTEKNISYQIANGKLMGTTSWDANTSTMLFTCWAAEEGKKITWSGNGGNQVWDNMSDNWSYDGKGLSYTGSNDVHFEDSGAGSIKLKGALTPGHIYVNNSTGKDYTWIAADATSKITGSNGLTKSGAGALRIRTAMNYTGTTEVQEGSLVLEADSTLNGSFINNARVEIASNTTLKKYSGAGVASIGGNGKLIMGNIAITQGTGEASAELQGSADAGEYSLGNAKYEIRHGKVTATGSTNTVIENKLTNTGVVNNSTKILVLNNSGNTLSSVAAITGDVRIQNKEEHEIEQLELADGRTVGSFVKTDPSWEATITITKAAKFGKNTTLLAHFELKSGASLMMTDTVTMGSDLILHAGAILEGEAYNKAFTLTDIGATLVLFDSVDYLILKRGDTEDEYYPGELTTESKVLASTYFKNLSSRNDLYITFDNLNGGQVSLTVGEALVVPEPATATLSLLALAAMAARRRRR